MAYRVATTVSGEERGEVKFRQFVLKPDCGREWIPNRVTKGVTQIRFIPGVDPATNQILPGVVPQAAPADPTNLDLWLDCLDDTFAVVPLAEPYINGLVTFIASVVNDDPNLPAQSPIERLTSRLSYKLWEQEEKRKKGHPVDVPVHWLQWRFRGVIPRPTNCVLAQVLVYAIDGKPVENAPKPGVMAIPRSALQTWLTSLLHPGLGSGTEYWLSPANGHIVQLYKVQQNNKTQYVLSLSNTPAPLPEDDVRRLWRPWSEILYIPTPAEQIEQLLEIYEPKAVGFALRGSDFGPGFESLLPDEIVRAAADIAEPLSADEVRSLAYYTVTPSSQGYGSGTPAATSPPPPTPAAPSMPPPPSSSSSSPMAVAPPPNAATPVPRPPAPPTTPETVAKAAAPPPPPPGKNGDPAVPPPPPPSTNTTAAPTAPGASETPPPPPPPPPASNAPAAGQVPANASLQGNTDSILAKMRERLKQQRG